MKFHYEAGARLSWPEECRAVGQPLIDAVEACWEQDPALRPTAENLARRLNLIGLRLQHVAAARRET